MRTTMKTLLLALAAVSLAACSLVAEQPATEVDYEYVGAVERSANSAGVDVVWVNPPRRERTEDENNG